MSFVFKINKKQQASKGFFLLGILIFASISALMLAAVVQGAIINVKLANNAVDREQAFHIAESGVEYYRWHLAHYATDYNDGNGSTSTGPYNHIFYNKVGKAIGVYTLNITPPVSGSTLVNIQSNGILENGASTTRKVKTQLAIPSLAKFAVAANDDMRFGEGTVVYGPIHSNQGIRFDGLTYNIISSSLSSYNDPDHSGAVEFGVHTHVIAPPGSGTYSNFVAAEAPASSVPSRTDVFKAGRIFPVSSIDFTGFTTDLSSMKSKAQASSSYYAASGGLGYRIVLKINGTYDLYKVNTLVSANASCSNGGSGDATWGTWSIAASGGSQTYIGNYSIPNNNVIFLEDNLWVEGQISNKRITIAAGKFPDNVATRPSITINNNLLYTLYDGSDALALVSQGDVNAGLNSLDTLRIDGALIAQNGRVGRHYYNSSCGAAYVRNTLTLYGMIATNQRYGFAYTDGTGYDTRVITYDGHFLYGPPPSFPLTSNQYQIISWEELK